MSVKMPKIVGIDLGTSTSMVAAHDRGHSRLLAQDERERIFPTVVALDPRGGGRVSVGSIARDQIDTNPEFTFTGLKRLLGRKYEDPAVQEWSGYVGYSIVEGPDGWAYVRGPDRPYSPIELLGHVFRRLGEIASTSLGERVTDCVVGVPAHFDMVQREAMRQAALAGGLTAQRLLPEPTAAAVAYGVDRSENRTIATYDFGGGTFDVSVLSIRGKRFHPLASFGDPYLGGEDFDRRIVDYVADEFAAKHGVDLRDSPLSRARLRLVCEQAKYDLSASEGARIQAHSIGEAPPPNRFALHVDTTLSRETFEEMVIDLVDRTRAPCREAMRAAKVDPQDISDVVLIGGMTRMPLVIETVAEIFGRRPKNDIDPMVAVAYGCATQGAVLSGAVKSISLQERVPASIGIRIGNGTMHTMLRQGRTLPARESAVFGLAEKDADRAVVDVHQGELKVASDNRLVAKIVHNELQRSRPERGSTRAQAALSVIFNMNEDGILTVITENVHSKERLEHRVHADTGMTPEAIDEMRRIGEEGEA